MKKIRDNRFLKQITATRTTLSKEWQENQHKIDWMHAPNMACYVNSLVSGKRLDENGHWAIYARDKHVQLIQDRRIAEMGKNQGNAPQLNMMSLGCGSGHIEESLIKDFLWPIKSLTGLEYDSALRESASSRFSAIETCDADFEFFDFNNCSTVNEKYDVIFVCHAIHHANDLENLLKFVNESLKDDGVFIGIDFFGPTRFQIEYDVFPIIQELFDILPDHLRRDLRTPDRPVRNNFRRPTVQEVVTADQSESVRSSDLRTLLLSNFPVHDIKPMGGTLLRWLFQYIAGNFDSANPDHVAIAKLLQYIEREMISSRRIRSDDLFFCLGKSDCL
jgi:SAM-dependent methyltransferase